MCMTMSGVQKPGASTVTMRFTGVFQDDPAEQARFHVPGGAFVAAAGVLFCVGLLASRSLEQVWLLLLILAVGFLLRAVVARVEA